MGSIQICNEGKKVPKRIYYNLEQDQNNQIETFDVRKTRVKLEFCIEGAQKKHKYKIAANFSDKINDNFITETINCNSQAITFHTCLICDYFFERYQNLIISLIKDSVSQGTISVSLARIITSPNSCFKTAIGNSTNIIITAQGISNSNSFIEFDFKVASSIDFKYKKNLISYLISSTKKIYSSGSISSFGSFDKIKIPTSLLENGFTITFYDSFQEVILYKNETIQSFTQCNPNQIYAVLNFRGNYVNIFNKSKFINNINFIDYIKNGVTIKLSIGIDYTYTNQPPTDPLSLHFLGGNMNDYEQAINACGMIIAYYDYNQLFPVYGFGAQLNGENNPNMCFNINMKQNPEIYTIQNVIEEYRKSFNFLILAGPSNFAPLIKRVIATIKMENDPLKYHILLILTDGVIDDIGETIDALVNGSFLPLSVIIIGIGNSNFKEMIELGGDFQPLISSNGIQKVRNLVQFVPFNKYKFNPNELAAKVLEGIPSQITEFYTMNRIYPDNLQQARLNLSVYN